MKGLFAQSGDRASPRSFLPEDYIERRVERRTNLLAIVLFAVVGAAVVGAFFVTNRQWNDVSAYQQAVNVRYAQAAQDIEQLKTLETQKQELVDKAELTTVLIERVPRSILLAELINRMPPDMTMLELQMKSTRLDGPKGKSGKASAPKPGGKAGDKGASMTTRKDRSGKPAAEDAKPVISAPRVQTQLIIIGAAPSHGSVARYVAGLQSCTLLDRVELKFSEETIMRDTRMNRFRIEAGLRDEADARHLEPVKNAKLNSIVGGAQPVEPAHSEANDDTTKGDR